MLKKLAGYYKKNGILSTEFTCPYKKICKNNNKKLYGPKSAYISKGYQSGNLPRLLFLSLDPGGSEKDDRLRLPSQVRKIEEKENIDLLPHNKHWYRTHELAYSILRKFNQEITIETAKLYFAHMNSVKCSENNPNHKKARSVLFKNCRQYIDGELEILNPDILITQGNEAREAIERLILGYKRKDNHFKKIISINNKKVYWFHTYHPRSGKYFGNQYDKGKGWIKLDEQIKNWYDRQS